MVTALGPGEAASLVALPRSVRSLESPLQSPLEIRLTGAPSETLDALAGLVERLEPVDAVIASTRDGVSRAQVGSLLQLQRLCERRSLAFSVDALLDGGADACAALARRPTSLAPVLESSRALRMAGVRVRWWIPVLPALAYRLEALFSLARDERLEPILVPASLTSLSGSSSEALDEDMTRFVDDFIAYRLLEEEGHLLSPARRVFYEGLRVALRSHQVPTTTATRALRLLEGDASGWTLAGTRTVPVALCETSDISDAPAARSDSLPGEVAVVIGEGLRATAEWMKTVAGGHRRDADSMRSLPRVLIIGAYGGEHIGDAAILGGVLLRIHRRYGTRQAILMSQRPEHTRHLVPMLDTPVSVTVEEYLQSTVPDLLQQVDGVVFAGGPLMDLPKQLVKHLFTVALARRAGKPFVLEGIGAGPFVRWPSAWTARRLVRMAGRISVRTSDDGRAPLVRGLRPEVGRDPAFDYLETRTADLTRLPQIDREWVDRLLKETDGRVTIGINLRPIRADYTTDTAASRRVAYTRFVETLFEERLTEAMRQFHKASSRPPCFVFFPMNAIQFGLSDLRSAYRLQRLLRGDVDFRIWEGDASIDGVVALLRRLDIAITMRFHATIYALVQQRKVIGIDYRVGRRDKVAALLTDFGKGDYCTRIDEMTTPWLLQRLTELSA